ncbi:MAG: outer membrane protein transport protein [bacterium]
MKRLMLVLLLINVGFVYSQYVPGTPFTTGYNMEVGARPLSMGGAYTAMADDYYALYYNPAGLGQIKDFTFSGSFSNLQITDKLTFYDYNSTTDATFSKINSFGAAIPLPTTQGSLVIGIGYNRVRDFGKELITAQDVPVILTTPVIINSNEYLVDFDVWDSAEEYQKGSLSQTSVGASIEVAPDLYVGGGVNFWSGTKEYTWNFNEIGGIYDVDIDTEGDGAFDTTTTYMLSDLSKQEHYKQEYSGINFSLGFLARTQDKKFSFGGVIKSPVNLEAKEDWEVIIQEDVYPGYQPVPDSTSSGYGKFKVQSPWIFRCGAAYKYNFIRITGDIEFKDYSQIQFTTNPPVGNKYEENKYLRRNLEITIDYAVGGEITVPGLAGVDLILRGGYSVKNSPYKYVQSSWDKKTLTFGAGVVFSNNFSFNVGYGNSSWIYEGDLIDKEDIELQKIYVDISYSM